MQRAYMFFNHIIRSRSYIIRHFIFMIFLSEEVSAIFQLGTSLSYSLRSSSILSDGTLRGENVSLSFRTNRSPALLLYVSSYQRQYLALLLNKNGNNSIH